MFERILNHWRVRAVAVLKILFNGGMNEPPLSPCFAIAAVHPTLDNHNITLDVDGILKKFSILLGVPKFRTPAPRKQTRKFSYNKLLTAKTNLIPCQTCGEYHEAHTICDSQTLWMSSASFDGRLLESSIEVLECRISFSCKQLARRFQKTLYKRKCYEKVLEVTNAIKRKMMQYNPYIGERQNRTFHVKFKDDEEADKAVVNGKRIIELDTPRPSWFKPIFKK